MDEPMTLHSQKIKANYRKRGACYESICAGWLEKQGFSVIEKNYRCRMGEIDIVAVEESTLVFVEVKFRKNRAQGDPAEAVNRTKQHRIRMAALWYLKTHHIRMDMPVRFDVVGICGGDMVLYRNAF